MTPATSTAGLRGAFWDPSRLPSDARLSVHPLRTEDGQVVSGFLLARGGETSAAVLAHPREHLVPHYLATELLRAGFAVFLQAPRLTGNDIRLEHEIALYDLAAAMTFLREQGFRELIAVGNSGGGPLWALYNQQALLTPDKRIAATPGGRPTRLERATLPAPDRLIFVSTHLGQGELLLNGIDPSVTDEADAFSIDPSLDPFDPANGYAPEGKASYPAAFVDRYRAAQRKRIARIDRFAVDAVQARAAARERVKANAGDRRDRARTAYSPIFPVWRTDADLRCWDLGLDSSDRRPGSLWGADPFASNYGSIGFGRVCTPESWLSTWSANLSNASMRKCAPSVEQPTLLIEYTGDASTFPSEVEALYGWLGTSRKSRVSVRGDHHGRSLAEGDPNPKEVVGRHLAEWLGASGQSSAPITEGVVHV